MPNCLKEAAFFSPFTDVNTLSTLTVRSKHIICVATAEISGKQNAIIYSVSHKGIGTSFACDRVTAQSIPQELERMSGKVTLQNTLQSRFNQINRLKGCNVVVQIRTSTTHIGTRWFFSSRFTTAQAPNIAELYKLPARSLRVPLSTLDCPLKSNYFSEYLADYQTHGASSGPFQPSRVCPFSLR